jgi:hypothetical protein
MAAKDCKFVVKSTLFNVDRDGTISFYFSDACDGEDQETLRKWGYDLTDSTTTDETNVAIIVDIPTSIHELLGSDYGHESATGGYAIEAEYRPTLEVVKKQLEDALAMFNRIEYENEEPLPAPDPEKCNNEVYKNGISLGFFDMTKQEAEVYCKEQTAKTGHLHDWHFIGGRVHVKALTTTK